MSSVKFRADIGALRALAVIAVVFYHFKFPAFSGGFVGVDVFFVISGYLMARIVIGSLQNTAGNGFSFYRFYLARAKRIVPALLFLCAVLLLVGWFYVAPSDYDNLAREVERAVLFLSNSYYSGKSGYFDAEAHERLLLHTWSLSVEWQFYLAFPVFVYLLNRFVKKLFLASIVLFFLLSFSYSSYQSVYEPIQAFYLLPSRAWELLAGTLAYLLSIKPYFERSRPLLFCAGIAGILLAIFGYSFSVAWPGVAATLPVFSTVLVILAGTNNRFISHPAIQKIGNWSYSIYLWHWPFVVAMLYLGYQLPSLLGVALVVLSIALGWASFRFVETPFRTGAIGKNNKLFLAVILALLAAIYVSAREVRQNKGYIERAPEDVHAILSSAYDLYSPMYDCHRKRAKQGGHCIYGSGEPSVIVLGDSHAMSVMDTVVSHYSDNSESVLDLTMAACPSILGARFIDQTNNACLNFVNGAFQTVKQFPDTPVIIVNRFSAHMLGLNEGSQDKKPTLYIDTLRPAYNADYTNDIYTGYKHSICQLAKNRDVFVLTPTPEMGINVPKTMGRSLLYRGEVESVKISRADYERRNLLAKQLFGELSIDCGVNIVEIADYFCDHQSCYGDENDWPLYMDDDHLNRSGSAKLLPVFERIRQASQFNE